MEFKKARRSASKMKMSVAGPSGSGKSMSSLLLAYGLTGDWSKIGVVDTENGSANLYSNLGDYNTLTLKAPFSPERYVKAIEVAQKSGVECLVIDSLSHCWEAEGGILQTHANMAGNSFTNWSKLTPVYNRLIQAILQCDMHVIVTLRSKQEYAVNTSNGKAVPEKLGLKPIARDGIDYEFSIAFDINHNHSASVSKDRTGLFRDKVSFTITSETGKKIKNWCESSLIESELQINSFNEQIEHKIKRAETIEKLQELYDGAEMIQNSETLRRLCTDRKEELLNNKFSLNGTH